MQGLEEIINWRINQTWFWESSPPTYQVHDFAETLIYSEPLIPSSVK